MLPLIFEWNTCVLNSYEKVDKTIKIGVWDGTVETANED